MVALIIVSLSKFLKKSSQNPLKIRSKSLQNRPKTLPEPSLRNERIEKSIFSIFLRFVDGPGPAQIEPKSEKISKILKKSEKSEKSEKI